METDRNPAQKGDDARTDQMFAVRLMEHLVVPTFVLDPRGRVLIWNRACERLTGVAAADVLGTDEHWRGFYASKRPCLADLVLDGGPGRVREFYAVHGHAEVGETRLSAENWCDMPVAGFTRYLAIDAGTIYDDKGCLLAVVETLRDMTAQKQAQVALEALAGSDGLTGIANRRMFDRNLEQACKRVRREGLAIALLMIDIDHFKAYNDGFGHQAGDECLKQVAAQISAQLLRPTDLVARYGGEEFAAILPGTSLNGALIVADRVLTSVTALALKHPASPKGIVTLSIGVAYCDSTRASHCVDRELLAQADLALYRAKADGRGRVAECSSLKTG